MYLTSIYDDRYPDGGEVWKEFLKNQGGSFVGSYYDLDVPPCKIVQNLSYQKPALNSVRIVGSFYSSEFLSIPVSSIILGQFLSCRFRVKRSGWRGFLGLFSAVLFENCDVRGSSESKYSDCVFYKTKVLAGFHSLFIRCRFVKCTFKCDASYLGLMFLDCQFTDCVFGAFNLGEQNDFAPDKLHTRVRHVGGHSPLYNVYFIRCEGNPTNLEIIKPKFPPTGLGVYVQDGGEEDVAPDCYRPWRTMPVNRQSNYAEMTNLPVEPPPGGWPKRGGGPPPMWPPAYHEAPPPEDT